MTFIALMRNYQTALINQPCLQDRRMHDMLTLTYRALNGNSPVYIKNLLNVKDITYNLRGQHLLNVPRVNTTTYGLHFFVILLQNSGTPYQTHLEPLLRPMLLNQLLIKLNLIVIVVLFVIQLNLISYLYTLLHTCDYVFIIYINFLVYFSLFNILLYFFEDISIIGCYL